LNDGAVPGPVRVGLRFRVGAAGAALGLPAHELTDARVALSDLWPDGDETAERIAESPSTDAALHALTTAVAARIRDAQPVDPLVRRAAVELNDPRARVADIAADAGVSQRHLLRRFKAGVGYGPKTLARVLRLQRFVAAVRAGGDDAAWLAADAGYADQSHLTRDCTELAGATPGALIAARRIAAGDASLVSSA
jgi:AraC-like DNA-binding protein